MMNATVWPQPADPDAAVRLIERFAEKGEQEADLAGSPAGRAMLQALGGGSPFLSDLSLREHRTVLEVMQAGPDQAVAEVHSELEALAPSAHRSQLAAALRQAKRRAALITAMADISGIWQLGRVTSVLSWLAETTLRRAVDQDRKSVV